MADNFVCTKSLGTLLRNLDQVCGVPKFRRNRPWKTNTKIRMGNVNVNV